MWFIFALRIVFLFIFTATRCASINITTSGKHANDEFVECNSNITVICQASPNTRSMIWRLNGSQIASCNFGYCSLDPTANNRFHFHYNTTIGEFNMSVQPVTKNESSAEFGCNVGSSTALLKLNVTDDFSIHSDIVEIVNLNQTHLIISTGCISKETTVLFQWKMTHATNSLDNRLLPDNWYTQNSSECKPDSLCGGTDKNKQSSTLLITEDVNSPDSYYLTVTVIYGKTDHRDFPFTDRTFKIRDKNVAGPKSALTTGIIVGIVVGSIAFVVVVILIVIVVIFVLKKGKCAGKGSDSKK